MKNDKTSPTVKKGKPSFKEANDIWPVPEGQSKNGTYDKSMFNADALGSEINTTPEYSKKGKGSKVDKGVFKSKPNNISPTSDY